MVDIKVLKRSMVKMLAFILDEIFVPGHKPKRIKKTNQSILKEINLEYSLEGLILKLKLQYFDHLMRRADSLEKTLILGEIEGRTRG